MNKKSENIINGNIHLNRKVLPFMKYRKFGYLFSVTVVIISLFFIITKGFNWGLDFTGGTVIETTFSQPADLPEIRNVLKENGYDNAIVQTFGSVKDVVIRTMSKEGDTKVGAKIVDLIRTHVDKSAQIHSVEFVGPNVGKELTISSVYATLATLAMLLLYVGFRFEWRLGTGAILSLTHDIIVTLGFFAYFQIDIDLTFVAAILSVLGYSLNDSIVVFDRVRENFRKIRRTESIDIIDISLTQTLSRTLMTSATTLIVVLALYIFGGPSIHSFSFALLIGIGFGTYSSIYVAIALAYDVGLRREHMIPPATDKEDLAGITDSK